MNRLLTIFTLCITAMLSSVYGQNRRLTETSRSKPNVIIILSDDQGYGDVGFNGCTDIPTPNLDKLAWDGIRFSSGYATHPYCSPSRAGLISGRYQQRFGHENNTPYKHDDPEAGLPLTETTIADVMKEYGYATAAIGKWHLGDFEKFWPNNRGFDYWYGFYGGGMDYWGNSKSGRSNDCILRNGKIVPRDEITYLTDNFSDESVKFIDRNADRPFFLYLAYNAPHTPNQAPQKYLDRVKHIEDGQRAVYASMVVAMDVGIGRVIKKLKEKGIYDNTLIFFYSDNGAATNGGASDPYRGIKGMLFEGGIHVPFTASWPSRIPAGEIIDEPVSALDLFPSILSAAGIKKPKDLQLDGVDLLPRLLGHDSSLPSRVLYWRVSDGAAYAVRKGAYKMVKSMFKSEPFLFDLRNDPYEHKNLVKSHPEKFNELLALYKAWNTDLVPSKWWDPHFDNRDIMVNTRKKFIDDAKSGEKR